MKLTELITKLSLTVFTPKLNDDPEITEGYTGDLFSDVMGSVNEGSIWITLQTHRNVAAIASLKEVAAILLVKGLKPDHDMLNYSIKEGVTIVGTSDDAFHITGKIYSLINDEKG